MKKIRKWCEGYGWCLSRLRRAVGDDARRAGKDVREAAWALAQVTMTACYWLLVPFVLSAALLVAYPVVAFRRMSLVEESEDA